MKKVGAELKNEVVQAIVKWAEKKAWSRLFKVVWFKRWRWLVMLAPMGGLGGCVPDVMAQSFTVDVDYQLQRQYKGPLLRHEVFTNAAELAAYVAGGAASRAYAGQIVVLVEGGVAEAYALEPDGSSGLMGRELGRDSFDWSQFPATGAVDMAGHGVTGAADVVTASGVSLTNTAAVAAGARSASKPVPYKDVDWHPWDWRTDEWGLGFKGIGSTNSVWIDGGLYSLGGYRTVGTVTVGDHYLEGMSVSSHGRLSQNRLSLAWAPEPWRYGQAHLAVVGYDLLTLKVDGDANTMTELQNPRLIIHGGLQADTNNVATNTYGGELAILGTRVRSAGAADAGTDGAAFGRKTSAGVGGLAAGTRALGADGAFVFADSQEQDFKRGAVTDGFSVRAQGGTYFETATLEVTGDVVAGGNVKLGTAFGTNTIAGDTQIGNSERRIEIDQKGLAIIDAVTEETEFAVEQYAPSQWRVDLKGNPLTNAGVVSATGFLRNGTDIGALAAAALSSNVWATAPGTTNYMQRTVQVQTNAALQAGINARVPTNDIRYLASLTNAAAFATKAQGVRADLALTNLSFGVTGTVAYRGDWGQSASNLAYAASTGKVDKTDSSYSRTNHGHGLISDEGKIGVTPGFLVETATGGFLGLKPKGTTEQWLRGDGQWSEPAGWQNTANATNWTWELVIWGDDPEHFGDWQNRIVARLTGYSGPPHCVVPDYLDGHPVAILGGDWDDPGWDDPGSILSITAGPNLDYITAFAIVDLTNLYLFNAPGITRLGEGAFVGCTRLEELRFPKTMEYVEGNSLFNLSNLQAVYWGGDNILDNNPYGGTTTQVVTYVTNPTAKNWPDVFYGHPVVRMAVTASNVVAQTITADNYGEVTAAGIALGGVRRASWPGHYWPAQSATYKEYKFPAGDLLYGDGTNLFYVPASGTVTNKITAN